MNLILFDDNRDALLPLTYTRPVADIRIGIHTIREKWEQALETSSSSLTEDYLSTLFPNNTATENLVVNGSVCPNPALVEVVKALEVGTALVKGNTLLAANISQAATSHFSIETVLSNHTAIDYAADILQINQLWDIFLKNGEALQLDFDQLDLSRSQELPANNTVMGKDIYIATGAIINHATLNTETGPIYIGKGAEIMEGAMIRGPFAIGDNAVVKMGAKIYGATTIGPHCKIGGEINNSVLTAYSNKAHDGFLGNSVIGAWCNLGADTNNSNLKNNYSAVKVWDYADNEFSDSGQQFCGIFMGDHAKTGINTMLNTGTVVGVAANIFGGDFPPKFIPSFSWGGASGFQTHDPAKALETAQAVMARRKLTLDDKMAAMLKHIFDSTQAYRV